MHMAVHWAHADGEGGHVAVLEVAADNGGSTQLQLCPLAVLPVCIPRAHDSVSLNWVRDGVELAAMHTMVLHNTAGGAFEMLDPPACYKFCKSWLLSGAVEGPA